MLHFQHVTVEFYTIEVDSDIRDYIQQIHFCYYFFRGWSYYDFVK